MNPMTAMPVEQTVMPDLKGFTQERATDALAWEARQTSLKRLRPGPDPDRPLQP
jgi:hypothetical protein